ncbi:MAG: preprotein translocase subunit SecG [Pseudomonadota bacterium]
METVIIAIHLMVVIALVVLILLQKSEGGALGIGGGGGAGGFMSGRGTANVLTRATTFLAFGFFTTSIILTLIANQSGGAGSILDGGTPAPGVVSDQPSGPATTDDLLNQIPGGSAVQEDTGPQVPLSE